MSTWTTPARDRLEDYLKGNRRRAAAAGADAEEVASDLRHHIEEEIAALKLAVVTEQDVQRIIARTGSVPEPEVQTENCAASKISPTKSSMTPVASGSLLFFGVVLPLATLIIELVTHICAGAFFDPLPTWFHVIFVATVPVANAIAWILLRVSAKVVPRWLWWLNAAALGTGIFYTAIFLPMSPLACIGVLFLGLGLLPLSPLFSLVCTLRLGFRARQRSSECGDPRPRYWWVVGLGTLLFLTLFAVHAPLTRHWIDMAASDSPEDSTHAIRMLRYWGSEEVILKEAYGRADRLDTELFNTRRPNPDLAQKVFYRVTGKAFNAVLPPLSKYQRSARGLFDDFEWDNGLGGETVAGQVRGLSLQQSRMDGVCQPDVGWAYLQWTFEFRNDHENSQREARAQVLLPPGGVVSRVTLWVNGEPCEAAFAGRGETRAAYQKVAVQQRRDPILVTMSGPDRVLMQCFPIQPNGGTMKVRLGITVPLLVEKTNEVALRLPCVVERNFKVAPRLEHSFWLESPRPARAEFAKLNVETVDGKNGIRGQIPEAALANANAVLRFPFSPSSTSIGVVDPKNKHRIISQTLTRKQRQMPKRIAIVLDGSDDMTEAFPQVARALNGVPFTELAVWLAQDGERQLFTSGQRAGEMAASTIGKLRGLGGQDDLPALLQAWEWAAAQPHSVVLWIHGAQPVLLNGMEALKQRLDWRADPAAPTVIDAAVRAGPNRIAEQFATSGAFTSLPRTGRLQDDLDRLFATWTGREPEFVFVRTDESTNALVATNASSHIVRLWAEEQIRKLARIGRVTDAVNLAAEQQLVTMVSGAVVLETKQQFQAAGLTPADPATVPTVPEPDTWLLLALGTAILCWFGTRRTPKRHFRLFT